MPDTNSINLSDEEIAKASSPEDLLKSTPTEPEENTEESNDNTPEETSSGSEDSDNTSTEQSTPDSIEDNSNVSGSSNVDKSTEPEEQTTVNYEEFYKNIMRPFKANGREISVRNANEVIQLMQQGANYTRKMQALAPHRKLLIMLENNGLLDEAKLNYLIDLDKKNPDAIRKLVKESGIDTLDLSLEDDDKPVQYQPKNYGVSDETASFIEVIDELKTDPEGYKTLQEVHTKWDTESINMLAKNPSILNDINTHRQSGIYDMVRSEVERQKVLGNIPSNTPFLTAYKAVGDIMNEYLGKQNAKKPIARGTAPKPNLGFNNARVNAASPTRSNNRKTNNSFNPLRLSDEEFMKQFEQFKNRV